MTFPARGQFTVTPLSLFRGLAIAEAITWTLLITGLVLRATLELEIAVSIGGGVHGFVFLAYAATALIVGLNQRWSLRVIATAIGSAVIPYATIPVELWLTRSGRLAGPFRLAATDDARDHRLPDRALRMLLRHPLTSVAVVGCGVIVVFSVLLIVGPPGSH